MLNRDRERSIIHTYSGKQWYQPELLLRLSALLGNVRVRTARKKPSWEIPGVESLPTEYSYSLCPVLHDNTAESPVEKPLQVCMIVFVISSMIAAVPV